MKVLCKDCWITHDLSALRARCKRCEEKREFVSYEYLSKKKYVTASGEYVCKTHREQPLDVYCDNCRRRLSLDALMSDGGVVAILGDSGSGKSTFLYVLRRALGGGRNARVQIRQAIGDSDKQLKEAVHADDGTRMSLTPERTDATMRNYAWELVSTRKPEESWIVAFHDAAGATWRDMETLSTSDHPAFFRYLKLITAAILVIDGERLPSEDARGTYPEAVQEAIMNERSITQALSRRLRAVREPIRGAVAISKSDLLWERRGCELFRQGSGATPEEIRDQVRRLLLDSGRKFLLDQLDSMGLQDYFAVSALGEGGAAGNIENAKPERIAEPVLSVIGFNDSRSQA